MRRKVNPVPGYRTVVVVVRNGLMQSRESDADRFRAAHAARLAKLGDVRSSVLRDLALQRGGQ